MKKFLTRVIGFILISPIALIFGVVFCLAWFYDLIWDSICYAVETIYDFTEKKWK